ncbi:MAG: tRNA (cytidine(34)-2'-O)-methyltransferase [Candidatus Onthovivens sp.]|nr:tRNA (cytidine(34)-2'-O)-methyltransferase [Candidatus Onthovivens sp.]
MIYIILYRPEKPSNVGNIMRTVSATDTKLIIIGPLSFRLTDKDLQRAGMDYLKTADFEIFDDYEKFCEVYGNRHIYYVTRYSKNLYSQVDYSDILEDVFLMFGRESSGIPHDILRKNIKDTIRIPMIPNARSLNLSNCVALVTYEVLRQRNFYSLATYEEIKGSDFLNEEIKND